MEPQFVERSEKSLGYVESAQVRRLLDGESIGFDIIGNALNLGVAELAELSKAYDDYSFGALR